MKYSKDLKQVFRYSVMLGYLPSSPFEHFKCTYKKVKREFLDQDELDTLYNKKLPIQRLAEVRDCYIFSCYTGYAYSDAEALSPEHEAVGIDGSPWIIRDRKKLIQQRTFHCYQELWKSLNGIKTIHIVRRTTSSCQ